MVRWHGRCRRRQACGSDNDVLVLKKKETERRVSGPRWADFGKERKTERRGREKSFGPFLFFLPCFFSFFQNFRKREKKEKIK